MTTTASLKKHGNKFIVVATLALIIFLGQTSTVFAKESYVDDLLPGKPVIKERGELISDPNNCLEVLEKSSVTFKWYVTYPDGWKQVIPPDRQTSLGRNYYYFCAPAVYSQLEARDGSQDVTGWQTNIIWIVNGLSALSASIAIFILNFTSKLLGYTLGIGSYITNPVVINGWPFVQGIANIGFIIVLLYIALGTILEPAGITLLGGQGVRRLLPRLLLAALLINFSLVIAGILIDASRIFMAIMVNIATTGGNDLSQIGLNILKTSGIVGRVFKETSFGVTSSFGNTNWGYAFMSIRATLSIWALAIGMTVISFGMFIRYIALLLLLIASPMAYLLIILPQTANLGKRWWSEFIKWVLYGPIALFILVLVIGTNRFFPADNNALSGMQEILTLCITVAMLIIAGTVGKSLGGAGSSAIMSFADRTKRAAYTASGVPLGIYAGKKGAQITANAAKNSIIRPVQDLIKEASKPLRKGFGSGEFSKYDKDGNLKAGRSSWGSRLGKKVAAPYDTNRNREIAETTALAAKPGAFNSKLDDPALIQSRLKQGHVLEALSGSTPADPM